MIVSLVPPTFTIDIPILVPCNISALALQLAMKLNHNDVALSHTTLTQPLLVLIL